ncbi:MAG: metalloregulator ArsR/SmtB family transcription factor [Actinomycetota bacterium]
MASTRSDTPPASTPPADTPTAAVPSVGDGGLCCGPLTTEPIGLDEATEMAVVLKALADPVRLRLVSIIAASESGEACACDLPALVDRTQPTTSHHLSQLVKAGFLDREQRGKWAWFRVRRERLDAVCAVLAGTAT